MALSSAIETLETFSDSEIPSLIEELKKLTLAVSIEEKAVEALRNKLKILLVKEEARKEGFSLADAAYNLLLALAELKPLNDTDPATMEAIPEDKRVFIADGQQFSIETIVKFHHARPYRSDLGEEAKQKRLLNPRTSLPFEARDVAHIMTVAAKKGLIIRNLFASTKAAVFTPPAAESSEPSAGVAPLASSTKLKFPRLVAGLFGRHLPQEKADVDTSVLDAVRMGDYPLNTLASRRSFLSNFFGKRRPTLDADEVDTSIIDEVRRRI